MLIPGAVDRTRWLSMNVNSPFLPEKSRMFHNLQFGHNYITGEEGYPVYLIFGYS
jgi:hypothetical protein